MQSVKQKLRSVSTGMIALAAGGWRERQYSGKSKADAHGFLS